MSAERLGLAVGDYLPSLTKLVTQKKMNQFEQAGRLIKSEMPEESIPTNIHTDVKRAREMGLSRPAASSQMSFAYLHELLARQFGIDFRQGGRLSVTFLRPVYAGDVVTAHGMVVKQEKLEHRAKLTLQVWLENQNGERTASGEAEVIIPSPLT
jgi:MaoC like domain